MNEDGSYAQYVPKRNPWASAVICLGDHLLLVYRGGIKGFGANCCTSAPMTPQRREIDGIEKLICERYHYPALEGLNLE